MKKIKALLLVLPILCICLSTLAQSQDDMKAWMAYSTPGDMHKLMAKYAGSWTGSISMWMQPGAAPTTSTGEATNTMIMGGRYMQGRNTGNFMGQPFEGLSITGYDNAKKVFVNSWVDNMGTGMMNLTGTWDAASNSITFTGNMVDPLSGKDMPVKEVLKFVDDNTQLFSMFMTANGQEFKTMEIKYTRK